MKNTRYQLGTTEELYIFRNIEEALESEKNGIIDRPTYSFNDLHVAATKVSDSQYGAKITENIKSLRDQNPESEKFLVLNNVLQIDTHLFLCDEYIYSNLSTAALIKNGNYTNLITRNFEKVDGFLLNTDKTSSTDVYRYVNYPVFCCLPTASHLTNFGCWLTQVIPQIEACRILNQTIPHVVSNSKTWYKNLLSEFFEDSIVVESVELTKNIFYKKIIIPIDFSAFKLSGNTVEYFEQFFKKYQKENTPKKIYISRRSHNVRLCTNGKNNRNFINEQELITELEIKDFYVLEPEKLSYKEMFTYLYNATHVISPGGANIFNAIACRKGTRIIDIEIGDWGRHHAVIFSSLKLDYSIYLGQKIDKDYSGPQPNFKIDVSDFLRFASESINAFDYLNISEFSNFANLLWRHLANKKFLNYTDLKKEINLFLPTKISNNLLFDSQKPLKVVLKTRNESKLLESWLLYHSKLVGWENIIVIDNNSDDKLTLDIYEKYKSESYILLSYTEKSPNLLHDVEFNSDLYKTLIGSLAKFVIMLDTDEFVNYFDKKLNNFNFETFIEELQAVENKGNHYGAVWLHNSPKLSLLQNCDIAHVTDYELNPLELSKNVTSGKCVVSTHSDIWDRKRINTTVNLSHNNQIPGAKVKEGLIVFHLSKSFIEARIKNNISFIKARSCCATEQHTGIKTITNLDVLSLENVLNGDVDVADLRELFDKLKKIDYHKLKETIFYLENKQKFLQSLATYNSQYVLNTNIIQHTIDTQTPLNTTVRYNGKVMSFSEVPFLFFKT